MDNVIERLLEYPDIEEILLPVRIVSEYIEEKVSPLVKPYLLKNYEEKYRNSLNSFFSSLNRLTEEQKYIL